MAAAAAHGVERRIGAGHGAKQTVAGALARFEQTVERVRFAVGKRFTGGDPGHAHAVEFGEPFGAKHGVIVLPRRMPVDP